MIGVATCEMYPFILLRSKDTWMAPLEPGRNRIIELRNSLVPNSFCFMTEAFYLTEDWAACGYAKG